jgi:aminoglycoside 6-adenylyltransferase
MPADRWSDLDVALVVDDPSRYAADDEWIGSFGRGVLLTFIEQAAVGDEVERRVLYDDGQDVDFALIPAAAARAELPAAESAVLRRGYRVIYDEIGISPRLAGAAARAIPPSRLSQEGFDQLTHDFWYHALLAAKKLRRGELLLAKQGCDCYLKRQLVELEEWRVRYASPATDTWHGGRFFEAWGGAVLTDLPDAFAAYEASDVARALRVTVSLFAQIEEELAARAGLSCTVPHEEITGELSRILDRT